MGQVFSYMWGNSATNAEVVKDKDENDEKPYIWLYWKSPFSIAGEVAGFPNLADLDWEVTKLFVDLKWNVSRLKQEIAKLQGFPMEIEQYLLFRYLFCNKLLGYEPLINDSKKLDKIGIESGSYVIVKKMRVVAPNVVGLDRGVDNQDFKEINL